MYIALPIKATCLTFCYIEAVLVNAIPKMNTDLICLNYLEGL